MEDNRFQALHLEMTNKCNLRCKHCYNISYLESNVKKRKKENLTYNKNYESSNDGSLEQ